MKIQNNNITAAQLPEGHPLREAAEGMEANFLKEMIRQMRNTVPENEDDKNNKALQLFRGMLDDEYAEKSAKSQGLGLADLIVRQVMDMEMGARGHGTVPVRPVNESDFIKK